MEEALDLLEAGEPMDVVVEGGEEVHVPAGGEHGEVGGQAAQPGDLLQGLVLPGGGEVQARAYSHLSCRSGFPMHLYGLSKNLERITFEYTLSYSVSSIGSLYKLP